MHARSTGAVDPLTRMPVQGRSRDGGQKTGVMEAACMLSHGTCAFLMERIYESSDPYRLHIDARTGEQVPVNMRTREVPAGRDVVQVEVPYMTKLLMQELAAMNIATHIEVQKR